MSVKVVKIWHKRSTFLSWCHILFVILQELECEAELILATLMESQQTEPLSQQPQPRAAGGQLGPAPGSAVPGDTPWNARGSLHSCLKPFCRPHSASACCGNWPS